MTIIWFDEHFSNQWTLFWFHVNFWFTIIFLNKNYFRNLEKFFKIYVHYFPVTNIYTMFRIFIQRREHLYNFSNFFLFVNYFQIHEQFFKVVNIDISKTSYILRKSLKRPILVYKVSNIYGSLTTFFFEFFHTIGYHKQF